MDSTGTLIIDLIALLMNALSTGAILGVVVILFMLIFKRHGRKTRLYE